MRTVDRLASGRVVMLYRARRGTVLRHLRLLLVLTTGLSWAVTVGAAEPFDGPTHLPGGSHSEEARLVTGPPPTLEPPLKARALDDFDLRPERLRTPGPVPDDTIRALFPRSAPTSPRAGRNAEAFAASDLTLFRSTAVSGPSASQTNEPSVATNGSVVFFTYNSYAAVSADYGATFRYIDPDVTFGAGSVPFCCDQRVVYEPTRDIFIWVLQYGSRNEAGFERLAVASSANVVANRWVHWDIDAGEIGPYAGYQIDFPQLATSSGHAYMSAGVGPIASATLSASGIARFPLDQLARGGTLEWRYAYQTQQVITPVQGSTTTMYFGAYASSSAMYLFSWLEGSEFPSSSLILKTSSPSAVGSSCRGPDLRDMCGRSDSRLAAGWMYGDTIGFAWNAGRGGIYSYPLPYIQMVKINVVTRSVVDEPAIWSDEVAYAYPGVAANGRGHLGAVVSFNSATVHPSTAVFVADDLSGARSWTSVAVRAGTAGPVANRWGDYQTSIRASAVSNAWIGGAFTIQGSAVEPRFIWFGRERDMTPGVPVPTATPRPSAAVAPTAAPGGVGQGRSLLPTAGEIGSGFTATDRDYTFEEKAVGPNPPAPYTNWADALRAWGWQAASERDLFNSNASSVYQVIATANIYSSSSGATSGYAHNLSRIAAVTGTPFTTANLGATIGDQSAAYTRDGTGTTVSGATLATTELLVYFRAGRVSNVVQLFSRRGLMDTALALRIAQQQAIRASALGAGTSATPTPSAGRTPPPSLRLGIYGTVTDARSASPLSGVCITLGPPIRCFTQTDAAGAYTIDLAALAATTGQAWDLYFVKDGYRQGYSGLITVSGAVRHDIALTSTATATSSPSPTPRPSAAPSPSAPPASRTLYLPNITKTLGGPTGWQTPFIIQNVGTTATDLQLVFYRFSDGAEIGRRSVPALRPGTSYAFSPNDDASLPHDAQFSVVVTSTTAPIVSVVNEHAGVGANAQAMSYVGASSGATKVYLPYVAKGLAASAAGAAHDGWLTTFVVQNVGASVANVTMQFLALDGIRTATLTRSIATGRAQAIDPAADATIPDGIAYSVTLTADQPIIVVANGHRLVRAAQTGYAYNGAVTRTAPAYLPYVARGTTATEPTSYVVIQNTGTADATPVVDLQRFGGGGAVQLRGPRALRPGQSWLLDPRYQADGTSPCPAAGSASCVGAGEFSAVISGGTFAALAWSATDTTAKAYTDVKPATTLYGPNTTRNLGGPSGWTTPLIIQSAGATSATLRWYRFADGALVTSQQLTGLTAGASVRIDPRSVSGLADNAQYAVVIEASASLVAIITELSTETGDGAMAYEALTVE